MIGRLAGCFLLIGLLPASTGSVVRAASPQGDEQDAIALRSVQVPEGPPLGVAGPQLLGVLERVAPVEPWRPRTNPEKERGIASKVYPRVAPAVVVVRTATGHGTGFVVAPDGWIVTNHHVVAGAEADEKTGAGMVSIHWGRLEDGRMRVVDEGLPGLVYKVSEEKDLALIKVGALPAGVKALPVISLADRVPAPGEDCVSIGHPSYGVLWTVRSGEVGGIGTWPRDMIDVVLQRLALTGEHRAKLDRVLNDAPPRKVVISTCGLNPGDSGGPLVDAEGRLIAVSFAIPKSSGTENQGTSVDKFSYHVHLDEVRAFLADRPAQPEPIALDPWPPAVAAALLDLDKDGTEETLAFSDGRGGKTTGLLIDLDQNSRRRNPSAKVDDFVEDHAWDFEFAFHLQIPRRAFYDTDGDGTIDLVLTGPSEDGKDGFALKLREKTWERGPLPTRSIIDPTLLADPKAQQRLARIMKLQK